MTYDNPFVKILETIANMLIVSFFWLIFSLPLITLVPSSAALYHTVNKVIFGPGRGIGVFKDFWGSFKENIKQGLILSLIVVVALLFIAEGLWTGYQIYTIGIPGMLYFILGILISLALIPAIIYIPVILSRFEAPIMTYVRLAVYFTLKNPFISILNVILLAFMAFLFELFPLSILITPALFADLLRPSMEKRLSKFLEDPAVSVTDIPEEEKPSKEGTDG